LFYLARNVVVALWSLFSVTQPFRLVWRTFTKVGRRALGGWARKSVKKLKLNFYLLENSSIIILKYQTNLL
jgi:hypothetical protein